MSKVENSELIFALGLLENLIKEMQTIRPSKGDYAYSHIVGSNNHDVYIRASRDFDSCLSILKKKKKHLMLLYIENLKEN